MSLLSSVLWIVALAAAVMAVVQLARQLAKLQEDLEEVRSAQVAPAAGPPRAHADRAPMFGGLYESKPSPFAALSAWPGVPLACAAAALLTVVMVTNRPGAVSSAVADSTAAQLAAMRLQHDSLARAVAMMHDSLAMLQGPKLAGTAPARRASATAPSRAASTSLARRPNTPESASGAAPLPSLPKVDGVP